VKGKADSSTPVKPVHQDPHASDLTGKALKRAYENALRSRANISLAALAIGGTVLGAILSNAYKRRRREMNGPVPAGPAGPAADARGAADAADARTPQGASGDDIAWKRSFAYDETKRVFDRQATVLSELRNRANIVVAADAVVATLFAMSVLPKKGHPLALEILALTAFALGIVACVVVLWPVHDKDTANRQWQVTFKLKELIAFVEGADSWEEWTKDNRDPEKKGKFQHARSRNWKTINRRTRYLEAAGVLLVVQIGLWVAVVRA